MATHELRFEDNVPGVFYVDDTCIDCDICRLTSPDNFERGEEPQLHSFVAKQPDTEEEYQLCLDAMEGCPTESIGDDGEAEAAIGGTSRGTQAQA